MLSDIAPHKLADDLRGRFILRAADFEKLVTQLALHPYANTDIFHSGMSVPNGYTLR